MILSKKYPENLKYKKNKLECICLNVTLGEQKKYLSLVDQIVNKTNKKLSKKIDFIIVTNKDDRNFDPKINELQNIFKNVQFVNINIPPEDDIYFQTKEDFLLKKNTNIPKYGLKSGPNILFFSSIKLLKQYNSTLFLETDCILSHDWLDKIINYVDNCNGFWISGALYDGGIFSNDPIMLTHINGGTAIYATGDDNFQELFQRFLVYFEKLVKQHPNYPYDWSFKIFLDENLKNDKNNHLFWKFANRNYVANKYILNFSPNQDKFFKDKKIMELFNYAILHKK